MKYSVVLLSSVAAIFASCSSTLKQGEMALVQGANVSKGEKFSYTDRHGSKMTSIFSNGDAKIASFSIGKTEITQKEFLEVMGTNPSHFQQNSAEKISEEFAPAKGEVQEKRPVENVSFYDAIAFCNKLSEIEGYKICYQIEGIDDWKNFSYSDIPTQSDEKWNNVKWNKKASGYRLPTQAEWEFAARGGKDGVKKSSQNVFSGSSDASKVAWFRDNSDKKTHETGKKKPNDLNIFDMSGNVREWCFDKTGGGEDGKSGSLRTHKGGSYSAGEENCALACNFGSTPEFKHSDLGFRVVRNAKAKSAADDADDAEISDAKSVAAPQKDDGENEDGEDFANEVIEYTDGKGM